MAVAVSVMRRQGPCAQRRVDPLEDAEERVLRDEERCLPVRVARSCLSAMWPVEARLTLASSNAERPGRACPRGGPASQCCRRGLRVDARRMFCMLASLVA